MLPIERQHFFQSGRNLALIKVLMILLRLLRDQDGIDDLFFRRFDKLFITLATRNLSALFRLRLDARKGLFHQIGIDEFAIDSNHRSLLPTPRIFTSLTSLNPP